MRPVLFGIVFASGEEREKFEHIYTQYKNLLLHKTYEILRDYTLAEDAASEAFLRIYKNLHKVDDTDSNRSIAFYVTIAKNAALTLRGTEHKKQTEEYEDDIADTRDMELEVLSGISSHAIYRLVDALSEELRSVFLLKFAYDMPHRAIGEALGISENNVTVRLHRAKKKLAQMLAKEGYVCESK
ncbi:sigma-70 family RNA polymerase sigma factor [Ruminococcaceae bacterium OttesenSCG-928-L11]|nr:sigma-70 family RNA polymerase sigma factor [Ruminococcaceae bacterium OttesenSCG-928-L11]